MDKRIKLFAAVMFVMILLTGFVVGEKIYERNTAVDIRHPIRVEGAAITGIDANITIKDPDNVVLVDFAPMWYDSSRQEHNYTLPATNTSQLGTYTYIVTAGYGSLNRTRVYEFDITATGDKLSTSQGIIYTVLLILSVIIFFITLWGAFAIPWKNQKDEEGQILSINDWKYAKIFCIAFSYMLLTWIAWLAWNVGYGYLSFSLLENFFYTIFWILLSFAFPLIITLFVVLVVRIVDDRKIGSLIDRGISVIR